MSPAPGRGEGKVHTSLTMAPVGIGELEDKIMEKEEAEKKRDKKNPGV